MKKQKRYNVSFPNGGLTRDLTAEQIIAKCRAREITSAAKVLAKGSGGFRLPRWRSIREFPEFAAHVSDTTREQEERAAIRKLFQAEHNPDPNAHCYLLVGGEQQGPFLPAQIRSMWNAGTITADTQFINSDLPDWRPVRSFCQKAQPPEGQTNEAELLKQVVAVQRRTATNTKGILWILFLVFVLPFLIYQCTHH